MKNNFAKIKYIIPVLALSFVIAGQPAKAASLESATKDLDTAVKQFINAKDENTNDNLSAEDELSYRKKIVSSAIDLSTKEIEGTKTKLIAYNLTKDEKDLDKLRTQSIESLNILLINYQDFSDKLDAVIDINGLKDIAQSLKNYRESTHNPALAQAIDLSLLLQSRQLSVSAENRWDKIDSDIKKLDRANLIQGKLFIKMMTEAKSHINNAEKLTDKTRELMTAPVKEVTTEEIKPLTSDKEEIKPKTARELSESALTELKSSYDIFIKISNSIKKSLLKTN